LTLNTQPKTSRGQKTLDRICRSAEELFSARGYYNTSINDITSGAQVAPGTFYIYFKDKLSVFKFLVEDLSRSLRNEIARAIEDCPTRYEQEHQGFRAFFAFLNRHRGLFKIIWEAQFVDQEIFRNYYEGIGKSYTRRLAEARDRGEVRPDADPAVLAYSFIGIVNFIGLKWIIFDDKPVSEEVIDQMMKLVRSGAFL